MIFQVVLGRGGGSKGGLSLESHDMSIGRGANRVPSFIPRAVPVDVIVSCLGFVKTMAFWWRFFFGPKCSEDGRNIAWFTLYTKITAHKEWKLGSMVCKWVIWWNRVGSGPLSNHLQN